MSELIRDRAGWETAHERAVARLAERTALALGLSATHARQLHLAGRLHDIGKRHIPREILDKPGPLSDDEWRQVSLHPILGQQILLGEGLTEIAEWVRCHHERFDGTGYPDGLAGTEIPLEGRILAAADAYHAMSSQRPYKEPMGTDDAALELRRGAGSQFDPEVVDALLRSLGHGFSFRPSSTFAKTA